MIGAVLAGPLSDSDDAVDHLVDWTGWEWAGYTLLTVIAAGITVVLVALALIRATSARYDDAWGAPILLGLLSLAAALAYGAGIHAVAMRCTSWNRAWLLILAVTAAAAVLATAAHHAYEPVSDWTLRWAVAPVAVVGVAVGVVDSLRRMAASIPMSFGAFVVAFVVLGGAGLVIARSQNAPGR